MTKRRNPQSIVANSESNYTNAKLLQAISPKLATLFAAKLFKTPIKHRIPKRELPMEENSKQTKLFIPKINKEIVVYNYGESNRKVLLVHGWSEEEHSF